MPPDPREPPLREGIYGNGIWVGQKINTPYTMAICNVATAFALYAVASGDAAYAHEAEACARFLCKRWAADGRPLNCSVYPLPRVEVVADLSRAFYLMEGLCWAHAVGRDAEVKALIERRLREWLLAPAGLLAQWKGSWFNFNATPSVPLKLPGGYVEDEYPSSKLGLRFFWEMAKATALPYLFAYYQRAVEDLPDLRVKLEAGLRFLSDPRRSCMTGVMTDPRETYGQHAVQATGFAGLSILEGIQSGSVIPWRS